MNVAFLGLGVMGYPMAGHLAAAGHSVTVYNRTSERADRWLDEYGDAGAGSHTLAPTPAGAAADADIVFACVGADDDLRAVCVGGDGAFATMKPGAVFVDHTTVSPGVTTEMAAAATDAGLGYIDAPVSGGEAGAVNGQLTVMCGGDAATYATVEPVIGAYAKMCRLIGPVGAGQTTKMVNQVCIAGVVQGLAEGLALAKASALDTDAVVEVISKGAAASWQMDNRWKTMAAGEFDFGFAVDWMRKDLAIVLEAAEKLGLDLEMTKLVDGYYAEIQDMGGNRQDTSSLARRFRD